jgi:hypothetical protein
LSFEIGSFQIFPKIQLVFLLGAMDLLSGDISTCDLDVDKDDLTLLNEILNTPAATPGSEFSMEWQAAFGSLNASSTVSQPAPCGTRMLAESDSSAADFFLPSCLLDMTAGITSSFLKHTTFFRICIS